MFSQFVAGGVSAPARTKSTLGLRRAVPPQPEHGIRRFSGNRRIPHDLRSCGRPKALLSRFRRFAATEETCCPRGRAAGHAASQYAFSAWAASRQSSQEACSPEESLVRGCLVGRETRAGRMPFVFVDERKPRFAQQRNLVSCV